MDKKQMCGNTICHIHYSKPMASNTVFMERSAFTTKEKKNILMEEANRRLRNCDPDMPWEVKREHLTTLNIQMMEAGHSQQFRDMVTSRSVARYQNSLKNHMRKVRGEGGRWLYRTKEERERQWEEQGGRSTKANWFRKGGHTSIMNVPATLGSELANRVKGVFQETTSPMGLRPGVQERPGRSVVGTLTRSNPFPRETCGRQLCPWGARGDSCFDRCYRESICYVAFCKICQREEAETVPAQQPDTPPATEISSTTKKPYFGESSRSLPTRTSSHFTDYRQTMQRSRRRPGQDRGQEQTREMEEGEGEEGEETSSWMADHIREKHGGIGSDNPNDDFEFHQLGVFPKVLERQVAEAVYLEVAETRGVVRMGPVLQKVTKDTCNRKGERFHFNPRGRQPLGFLGNRGRPPG